MDAMSDQKEPEEETSGHRFARALFDNASESKDELPLTRGELLTILTRSPSVCGRGWWLCVSHVTGRTGFCPVNRLKTLAVATGREELRAHQSLNALNATMRSNASQSERRKSWTADDQSAAEYDVPLALYDRPRGRESRDLSLSSGLSSKSSKSLSFDSNLEKNFEYSLPKNFFYDTPKNNRSIRSEPEVTYDRPKSGKLVQTERRVTELADWSTAATNESAALELHALLSQLVLEAERVWPERAESQSAAALARVKAVNESLSKRLAFDTDIAIDIDLHSHHVTATSVAQHVLPDVRHVVGVIRERELAERPLPEVPKDEPEVDFYELLLPSARDQSHKREAREAARALSRAREALSGGSKAEVANWLKMALVALFKTHFAAKDGEWAREAALRVLREARGACQRGPMRREDLSHVVSALRHVESTCLSRV